jgi:hypothetical protein
VRFKKKPLLERIALVYNRGSIVLAVEVEIIPFEVVQGYIFGGMGAGSFGLR